MEHVTLVWPPIGGRLVKTVEVGGSGRLAGPPIEEGDEGDFRRISDLKIHFRPTQAINVGAGD